jgi:hypothetical protein
MRRHRAVHAGLIAVTIAIVSATGCARRPPVLAQTPVVLNVPPAPPRVISMPPEPMAPVETTTTERPIEPRPDPVSRPPSRQDNSARPAPPPSAESETGDAGAAVVTQAPPAAPSGPLLRTPQTADETEAARRIGEVLARAGAALDRVNTATLTREARSQHETARRFVEQAQQALIERNFVFASYLADKAETLAKGLSR